VGVVLEALHELLDVLVEHRVVGDLLGPRLQLLVSGQLAEQNQVGRFEVVAVFGQLFDRVAAIEQLALVAVDVGDGAAAVRRVRNAGSYVISPKSPGATLIFRRSMARMVPSVTGTSYCCPVRLSVIVSVSAIGVGYLFDVVGGDSIGFVGPVRKVLHPAAFAAERTPGRVHRVAPAEHAQFYLLRFRGLRHRCPNPDYIDFEL
jgi:hypothetical protein